MPWGLVRMAKFVLYDLVALLLVFAVHLFWLFLRKFGMERNTVASARAVQPLAALSPAHTPSSSCRKSRLALMVQACFLTGGLLITPATSLAVSNTASITAAAQDQNSSAQVQAMRQAQAQQQADLRRFGLAPNNQQAQRMAQPALYQQGQNVQPTLAATSAAQAHREAQQAARRAHNQAASAAREAHSAASGYPSRLTPEQRNNIRQQQWRQHQQQRQHMEQEYRREQMQRQRQYNRFSADNGGVPVQATLLRADANNLPTARTIAATAQPQAPQGQQANATRYVVAPAAAAAAAAAAAQYQSANAAAAQAAPQQVAPQQAVPQQRIAQQQQRQYVTPNAQVRDYQLEADAARNLAQARAAAAALLPNTGVQPMSLSGRSFVVPAPSANVDYSGKKNLTAQGNGHFSMPTMQESVEQAEQNFDPLASPYYDPITGGIDIKRMQEAQAREAIASGKRPFAQLGPDEAMEARLRLYDQMQVLKRANDPNFKAFGDFSRQDEVYNSLPKTKDVFFVDEGGDFTKLQQAVARIEQNLGAEMGFVLLDNDGLVALKDNSLYPLYGLDNFHLAYAVARLMSSRGDTGSTVIRFASNSVRDDIKSPMLASLRFTGSSKNVDRAKADAQVTGAQRGKVIAEMMRDQQLGRSSRPDREEILQASTSSDRFKRDQQMLERRLKEGVPYTILLSELFNYALEEGDPNANDVLVNYLGSLATLEISDHIKGLTDVSFKTKNSEIIANSKLINDNQASLYSSAKLLALYSQDSELTEDARGLIDDIMYFNVKDRGYIQKGVRDSIASHSRRNTINTGNSNDGEYEEIDYAIYSTVGIGGVDQSLGARTVISDLALIKYQGYSVVMAISIRNMPMIQGFADSKAEAAIASLARVLFDYIDARHQKVLEPVQHAEQLSRTTAQNDTNMRHHVMSLY